MDLDAYVAAHSAEWRRLDELTNRSRRASRLSGAEVLELVERYQQASTHLAYVRSHLPDPALVTRLTALVGAAHGAIHGHRPRSARGIGRFFRSTFPAAVWWNRRFVLAAALLTFVPAIALGVWISHSDAALEAAAPAAVREAYVSDNFESYYSSQPAGEFAAKVFVNNVRVAMLAFAAGILLCVVTAFILAQNGALLGVAAGLFASVGESPKMWGLLLPHGVLELSAVVVAGAAGLRIGWTVIDPGDRRRADALIEEGRRSAAIVLGLILAFAVAGTIEGFVTGRGVSTPLRVGLGLTVGAAFWAYVVIVGRRAIAGGDRGLLGAPPRVRPGADGRAGDDQSRPLALAPR